MTFLGASAGTGQPFRSTLALSGTFGDAALSDWLPAPDIGRACQTTGALYFTSVPAVEASYVIGFVAAASVFVTTLG